MIRIATMRGDDRSNMFCITEGKKGDIRLSIKELHVRDPLLWKVTLAVLAASNSPLNRRQTLSMKTLKFPCCMKRKHTLLDNSLQRGKNTRVDEASQLSRVPL